MLDGGDLRRLRETANLSVREAAKVLHVASGELRLWEGHARRVPHDLFEFVRGQYAEPASDDYAPGQTEAGLE